MNIVSKPSRIRTIKSTDNDFMLQEEFTLTPRAGFEVDNRCPREYKLIIAECINMGWLRPVAHVKDHELFWKEFEQ